MAGATLGAARSPAAELLRSPAIAAPLCPSGLRPVGPCTHRRGVAMAPSSAPRQSPRPSARPVSAPSAPAPTAAASRWPPPPRPCPPPIRYPRYARVVSGPARHGGGTPCHRAVLGRRLRCSVPARHGTRLIARSTASPTPSTSSSSGSVDPAQLPPALRDIVALFQSVPDERTRYKQLLACAARLPPMDPALKTDTNRVRGCVSQVWVHAAPEAEAPGCVRFQADSDAQLTKGLAALLVLGLSGAPARDVAMVPVEFIEMLGIRQSLSPSRNSGLLNMINLMKLKALEIAAGGDAANEDEIGSQEISQDGAEPRAVEKQGPQFAAFSAQGQESSRAERPAEEQLEEEPAAVVEGNGSLGGGRKEKIRESLERGLSPVELKIEDISHLHKGHAGVAGSNGETHFNVRVVSKEFEGKSMLKRHRAVYDLLQDELKSGLHALSIDAKTPSEV